MAASTYTAPPHRVTVQISTTSVDANQRAPLKASSKTRYLTHSANPAKRVRAWARSRLRGPCRKENGSSGTNRPKKLPFVPPLPLTVL